MAAEPAQPQPDIHGRILEIGELALFQYALPEHTDSFLTSYRADKLWGRKFLTVTNLVRAVRKARRGDYRLIVLSAPIYPGWHPRSFLAALKFTLLKGKPQHLYGALVSPLLFELFRFIPMPPLIAIDKEDSFAIPSHQHFLFDKADHYFKRELPVDHWQVLYGSAHRRLPGYNFRSKKAWQRRIAKLKPLILSTDVVKSDMAAAAFGAEKTTDIFFAGQTDGNSVVRGQVPALIEKLRDAGFKVDYPTQRIPYDEFIQRCAQSWLTLSPEGLGWDCFRHVEAALAGSVPLMNAPTIHRYKPLVVGEQCLVYFPDEDNIVDVVTAALADKPRLERMARSAHEHAKAHLTLPACARDIVETYGRPAATAGSSTKASSR
ncbi:glycosyltransferase [Tepidamorphus sp. 3E244]|uniref:glycosyltransferase n=1 Tax=Tepidamorphus sp. 3E244 TaxID=3385498 RepID=UPI0038FD1D81